MDKNLFSITIIKNGSWRPQLATINWKTEFEEKKENKTKQTYQDLLAMRVYNSSQHCL